MIMAIYCYLQMDHQTQATQKEIPDDVSEAGSDMSCSSATSGVSVYSYSSKVRQTGPLCIKLKTDLKRGISILSFCILTLYVISRTTICLSDRVCRCNPLSKAVVYYNYRHQKPKRMLWKSHEKSRSTVPTSLRATRRDFHCAPVTMIHRNQFIWHKAHFSGHSTETF